MGDSKKRCFVIMGFGTKTDYVNGRKLDLNKSYRLLVKPVMETKGIECVRADEITHSGSIDLQMYRELLQADVVIADLSTANPNALYELGVRHALRPYTTIVISEDKLIYPFDLNHILITSYQHLGDAIDFEEVERFRAVLGKLIDSVIDKKEADSPVYTYLNSLIPPRIKEELEKAIEEMPPKRTDQHTDGMGKALSLIIQEAEDAIETKDFSKARELFQSAVMISNSISGQQDPYLIHRLAFCTYKAAEPNLVSSLYKSLGLLETINLAHTNDPETVASAGSVEKKLYENGEGDDHLENSILYYQRSYYLLNNRHNGINLAMTLVYHATSKLINSDHERIADLVFAQRTWKRVLYLCDRDWPVLLTKEKNDALLSQGTKDSQEMQEYYDAQKFWITVNRVEASFGLGRFHDYYEYKETTKNIPHSAWMWESFLDQLGKLEAELTKIGHLMEPSWKSPH